jgi:hypothetical protein
MRESIALYEVSAQLLPVLWIVYVLEMRMLGVWWVKWNVERNPDPRELPLPTAVVGVALSIMFIVAETVCLTVLRTGHANETQEWIVSIASWSAVLIVFMVPAEAFLDAIGVRIPGVRRWRLKEHEAAAQAPDADEAAVTEPHAEPPADGTPK